MHLLCVIHTKYMQCISACIGYIQIHSFSYHDYIHSYPPQRRHILNNDTYKIHTNAYRYIQIITIHAIRTVISDLYLACFLYVSCLYLVHICMYCIYYTSLQQNLLVSSVYAIYTDTQIYTGYIQTCTRYNSDTYTICADTYTFTIEFF